MATSVTSTGITFPDATTQTTAYVAGGGVSSVNAQTGAVVTTNTGSIGCTMIVMYGYYGDIGVGATCAGSILYYNYGANQPQPYAYTWAAQRYVTGGLSYGGGGTALTGTWRKMSTGTSGTYSYGCCSYFSQYFPTLFVRVS